MSEEKKAEALSMGLKEDLGPYTTKFAEHILDGRYRFGECTEAILTKEWDGAIPDELVGYHEEVSCTIRSILYYMADFSFNMAMRKEEYSFEEVGPVKIVVEPYYDGRSSIVVVHMRTETVIFRGGAKTYRFDPEVIEAFLSRMTEKMREGIARARDRL